MEGERPELDMLFMKAGMHGRGYGSILMGAMKVQWKDRPGLCLRVSKRNVRAVRFYQKPGFTIESEEDSGSLGVGG